MSITRTEDSIFEIARGNVNGMSSVNKFGGYSDVASDTEEDIWDGGGDYAFPTTAIISHLSQTADQAAMRGGIIEIQGLDEDWELVVQTKALNASNTTTPVEIDTPLIRVFRMKVLENIVSASEIRLHNAAETVDYAIIGIGNNQTLMAIYTVPAGKTAYLTQYYTTPIALSGKEPLSVQAKLWIADRKNNYEFQLKHARGISKGAYAPAHLFMPYLKVNEKSDIKITAIPNNEGAAIAAGFDLILIDN